MRKIILVLSSFLYFSCGQVQQVDTSDIKEIMRNSKPKRLTDKVLLDKVTSMGDSISTKFNGDFRVECQNVYISEDAKITFYDASLLSEKDFSEDLKGQLLEAYKFGIDAKQKLSNNVQTLNDSLYLYSFPLSEKSYLKNTCNYDFGFIELDKSTLVKAL